MVVSASAILFTLNSHMRLVVAPLKPFKRRCLIMSA